MTKTPSRLLAVPLAVLLGSASFGAAATLLSRPSSDARDALQQIVRSDDTNGRPFVVVDKHVARLWVFDARGRPRGSTPVLLGRAIGDHSVPGIGERPIKLIRPEERTTPAGRFVAERGHNAAGEDILWVDWDAAASMHRVRATDPTERRPQRLASPTSADNRISYGCINVPAAFYDQVLMPAFGRTTPIVYVLPEKQPVASLFERLRPH